MFSIRGELFIYPTETEHSVSIFFAMRTCQMRSSDVITYTRVLTNTFTTWNI